MSQRGGAERHNICKLSVNSISTVNAGGYAVPADTMVKQCGQTVNLPDCVSSPQA